MPEIVLAARDLLQQLWADISQQASVGGLEDRVSDDALRQGIRDAVNSRTKTYRYVLPTQLLAKAVAPSLDCRCIQVARGGPGAFDARTIAHKVVVPFDQTHENVLGGAPEPYVNNPLRVPEVSFKHIAQQKNRKDWATLSKILTSVQERDHPQFTKAVLEQVLVETHRRLSQATVSYPVPARISPGQCLSLLNAFLVERSGGDRLLAITAALFSALGERFRLFGRIRRAAITAADAATGMVGDIECLVSGKSLLAVEVKDRPLSAADVRAKIRSIRTRGIPETLFVARGGMTPSARAEVERLIAREFAAGHSISIVDLETLVRAIVPLLGEAGRNQFLRGVGLQLEEHHSDLSHRQAWAGRLEELG